MLMTLLGIVTPVRLSAVDNNGSVLPMLVTPVPIVTLVRLAQSQTPRPQC